MSGPRMGNLGHMNGRRPNISRMNYHENRQSSYQDRQSYQDHRQSHEARQHDYRPHGHDSRQHDSRQYDSRPHENRHHDPRSHENRQYDARPHEGRPGMSHQVPPMQIHSQHDELIRFIHDSWSKVEMDKGSNNIAYYQEPENHHLKDFRPFDLEAFWGRRVHQNHHQQHHS